MIRRPPRSTLFPYRRSSDLPFADDTWELYDTNTDWTQSHDLAAEMPEKLAELQALFMEEARKYNVLPDRKSTRLNSSHGYISYAVFCLKKKNCITHTT